MAGELNIQVCRLGEYSDWVKVLDFGLVKTQAGELPEPGLTAPNTVTGTPAYLSPESALGEAVDQRTDIYALGCVAYWMLTGGTCSPAKARCRSWLDTSRRSRPHRRDTVRSMFRRG